MMVLEKILLLLVGVGKSDTATLISLSKLTKRLNYCKFLNYPVKVSYCMKWRKFWRGNGKRLLAVKGSMAETEDQKSEKISRSLDVQCSSQVRMKNVFTSSLKIHFAQSVCFQ